LYFIHKTLHGFSSKKNSPNPVSGIGGAILVQETLLDSSGLYEDEALALSFLESDFAFDKCEERMILANSDVIARVKLRSPLTNQDRSGSNKFATKMLYAQSLAGRIAAVLGTTSTFL